MILSQNGLVLLKQFEGFSATLYICPGGYPTIGYGHLVRSHEGLKNVSKSQAEKILHDDAKFAERGVNRLIHVPLTSNQFDVLVSFTFNLGAGALQRSTLRRVLNRGDYSGVPAQLIRWIWAGGKRSRGLLIRRNVEAQLFNRP